MATKVEDKEEEKSSDKDEAFAFKDDEDRITEDEMTRLVENEVNMVFGMDLIRVMDIKSVPNNYYYFDDIKVRLGSFKSVLFGKNKEKSLFEDVVLSYYGPFGLQDNPIVTTYIRPRKLKTEVPFKSNYNLINLKQINMLRMLKCPACFLTF